MRVSRTRDRKLMNGEKETSLRGFENDATGKGHHCAISSEIVEGIRFG